METATTTLPLLVLSVLSGNDPTGLNTAQQILEPHLHTLAAFWGAAWLTVAIVVLVILWRDKDTGASV
jgi:hypothetical protein